MARHSLNPTVTGVDNRGNTEHPYGYVYFSDGNRLMFGDTVNGVGEYGLNVSNWGSLPRKPYFEIAETAIREALAPKTETGDDAEKCSDCDEPLEGHCDECDDCSCPGDHCPECDENESSCTCGDEEDEVCDECGCSANEFETDCECASPGCPANCYQP